LEFAFPVAATLFIDRLLPTRHIGLIALAALGLLAIHASIAIITRCRDSADSPAPPGFAGGKRQ
jgi:hypothetical protein